MSENQLWCTGNPRVTSQTRSRKPAVSQSLLYFYISAMLMYTLNAHLSLSVVIRLLRLSVSENRVYLSTIG